MDELDIEMFLNLMKSKNITKTAENLYTSQSAITKRIQKLEEDLNCQLFVRSKRGILPTPACENMLSEFSLMNTSLQKIRSIAASSQGLIAGTLDIGVSINYAKYRLSTPLKEYSEKYPLVEVNVTADQSTSLYRKLCNGDLSLCILRGDYPWEYGNVLLSKEPICLAINNELKDHALSEIPYIARKSDQIFETKFARWRKEQGIDEIRHHLQINDISTCLEMVKGGVGWTILPLICLKDYDGYVQPIHFQDGTAIYRETHMLYRDDYKELAQVNEFLKTILDYENTNPMV